jgi:uncharacterized protein YchJ
MRSRYVAYAAGHAEHLMRTTAPASPHWQADAGQWREDLQIYMSMIDFQGLTVLDAREEGDRGDVRFFATLRHADMGTDVSFGEHSRFVRDEGGRWLYLDGQRIDREGRPVPDQRE